MVKTVLSPIEIDYHVKKIASDIRLFIEHTPDVVCLFVLEGGMFFGVDIVREFQNIHSEIVVDSIGASSYEGKEKKLLEITKKPKQNIKGKTVILFDEYIDTGQTIQKLTQYLIEELGAINVEVACMIKRKSAAIDVRFLGILLPKEFEQDWLVGYGLDSKGSMRHLKTIYTC